MAQRYRLAGYEMEDQKAAVDMQRVTAGTQDSLLGKFEAIAQRQRERADIHRTRMSVERAGSVGSTAPSAAASPKGAGAL